MIPFRGLIKIKISAEKRKCEYSGLVRSGTIVISGALSSTDLTTPVLLVKFLSTDISSDYWTLFFFFASQTLQS